MLFEYRKQSVVRHRQHKKLPSEESKIYLQLFLLQAFFFFKRNFFSIYKPFVFKKMPSVRQQKAFLLIFFKLAISTSQIFQLFVTVSIYNIFFSSLSLCLSCSTESFGKFVISFNNTHGSHPNEHYYQFFCSQLLLQQRGFKILHLPFILTVKFLYTNSSFFILRRCRTQTRIISKGSTSVFLIFLCWLLVRVKKYIEKVQ